MCGDDGNKMSENFQLKIKTVSKIEHQSLCLRAGIIMTKKKRMEQNEHIGIVLWRWWMNLEMCAWCIVRWKLEEKNFEWLIFECADLRIRNSVNTNATTIPSEIILFSSHLCLLFLPLYWLKLSSCSFDQFVPVNREIIVQTILINFCVEWCDDLYSVPVEMELYGSFEPDGWVKSKSLQLWQQWNACAKKQLKINSNEVRISHIRCAWQIYFVAWVVEASDLCCFRHMLETPIQLSN